MRFTIVLDIDAPRDRVAALLDDPANLPKWQPDLLRYEPLAGTPGLPGSTTRLVYRAGGGELEMIETIVDRSLPARFLATYATKMGLTTMDNRFDALGPASTRWTVDTRFAPKGLMRLLAPLLGGVMRKQTRTVVERFKTFAEADAK